MTYELYWHGDPVLVKDYRQAFDIKKKQENERLWLQGFYNFQAISTALSNIHFDKKQYKINHYMDKPLDFGVKTEKEKKAEVENAKQSVINDLMKLKEMWDKKEKKGQ